MWKQCLFLVMVCALVGLVIGNLGSRLDGGDMVSDLKRSGRKDLVSGTGSVKAWEVEDLRKALGVFGLEILEVKVSGSTVVLVCESKDVDVRKK